MTSPFIFIGTYEFQPGKAEDFKTYWKEFWSTVVEPQEPRLLAFNAYVDAGQLARHRRPGPPRRRVDGVPSLPHHRACGEGIR